MPPTREDYLNTLTNNAATPVPQTNYAPIRGSARRPTPALTPDVLAGVQERLKPWTTGNTDAGGVGGFIMKALGALDMPRSAIASTIQETVDLFQGEGFSGSDWLQQTRQHHGFGDIIADMGIDAGLGGWGNRILGFVGDVATDPLMWLGGMGAYSRARGAAGLIDDMGVRVGQLKKMGDTGPELAALSDAISAAGKNKSVSAARNTLIRNHGDVGARIVDDLGIGTGLKVRVPGTGPVLGRISRSTPFLEMSAARRASQVPLFTQRRLAESLGDESLENLIRTASRREAFDESVNQTVREVARRAAYMPVEFSIPILKGTFGTIQALPGSLVNRAAVTKFGAAMGQRLGTTQSNMIASMARSENPDQVILSSIIKRGNFRGDALSSRWTDLGQRVNEEFGNRVATRYGVRDDLVLGRLTQNVSDTVVASIKDGSIAPEMVAKLAKDFPNLSLTQIAEIRSLFNDVVNKNLETFLLRPDVYGPDGRVSKMFQQVRDEYGGYSPQSLERDAVGGFDNGKTLLTYIWRDTPEDQIPDWVKGLLEPDVDYASIATATEARNRNWSRHLQERSLRPAHFDSTGKFVKGTEITIPYKNNPESFFKMKLKSQLPTEGKNPLLTSWPKGDVRFGMSVPEQVDYALKRAGWLGPEESVYMQRFSARQNGYISSLSRDIRLAANEQYLASRGILLNVEEFDNYFQLMQNYDSTAQRLVNVISKQDAKMKAKQSEIETIATVEGGLKHTFANTRRWREAAVAGREKYATEIDDLLKPLDELLGGTAARMELSGLIKSGQVSEAEIRSLLREAGQTLAESNHLVDELWSLRKELDSLLARAGLQPPERAIVREADGRLSVYHGLEDPPAVLPGEELLYGKAFNENLDVVRDIVPIMERLQVLSARSDVVDQGLVKLGSVIDQLETLAPNGNVFVGDIAARIADDIKFIREDLIEDISSKMDKLMVNDETVLKMKGYEHFFRGEYNQYYPSQLYRNSEEMFDSFNGVVVEPDGTPSTLGNWFRGNSHGIPRSREQLDSLNGFASHPRAAELQKISEDALKLKEETKIYVSVTADFEDHSIGWSMIEDKHGALIPLTENPVEVSWSVAGDTRLGSVVSDAAMQTGIPESELSQRIMSIVGRWMNNTVLLHADMSGRVLTATVESETAELFWKNLISLDGNLPPALRGGIEVDSIFPEPTDVFKQSAKGNAQLEINMRPIEDFFGDIEERLLRTDPVGMNAEQAEDVWSALQDITSPRMGVSWLSTLDPEDPFKLQRLWNEAWDDEVFESGFQISGFAEDIFDESTLLARRELRDYLEEINFTTELVNVIKRRMNMDYRRYNNYGRTGFRANTGPNTYTPMTAQSWIDLQGYNQWDSVEFIRREPLSHAQYEAAGMIPNQQNGLWFIKDGKKIPDVVATKANLLTGSTISTRLGRGVADPSDWVPDFKELESVIHHEFSQSVLSKELFTKAPEDLQKIIDAVNNLRGVTGARVPFVGATGAVSPVVSQTPFSATIDSLFSTAGRLPSRVPSFEESFISLSRATGGNPTLDDIHNMFKQLESARMTRTAIFSEEGKLLTSLRPETRIEDLIELSTLVKEIDAKLPAARKAYAGALDRILNDQTEKLLYLQKRHAEFAKSEAYWQQRSGAAGKQYAEGQRSLYQMMANKENLETQLLMNDARKIQTHEELVVKRFAKTENDLYNLNGLGQGDFDIKNISIDDIQALFNEQQRMWGPWRISGDQEFADQVTYALLAAQKMNDRQQVKGFLQHYDRVHNWMKAQMVATPGFVTRNIMGGMFNMWVDDIPLSATLQTGKMIEKAYRLGKGDLLAGLKAIKNPSEEVKFAIELVQQGAHAGGQAASAVERNLLLDRKLQWILGTKNGAAKGWRVNLNPLDAQFVLYSSIRNANTFAEEMLRLATGVHAMRIGGTLDDAIESIYKLHFNYGNLSSFESGAMKRVFPFYTWSRNNLPLQISQLAANPKRYNRLLSIKRNLEYGTEEEGNVPSYFLEPFGFRLPFSIGGSQVYSVPDLPFQDLLRFDPTGVGFVDAAQHILSSGSPMIKVPLEYWGGKQFFKGIPYTGRYQQVPTPWEKIPGLMPALNMIGWAEKNNRGEWKMMDSRIAVMDGLMPYIGRLRRMIPNESRYQERMIQTLTSTLGGLSIRINTPYEQRMQVIRQMIEDDKEWRDERDIRFRQR
jgi:hypothetical protein